MPTTGTFFYLDPASVPEGTKPWSKVDGPFRSFTLTPRRRSVTNIRDVLSPTNPSPPTPGFATDIDIAGFALHHAPATEKAFTAPESIRTGYYAEVESLLRAKLPGKIARVEIFDHTIRRHDPQSPRQPVQQVHVDQTPAAAAARVRRHVGGAEAEGLLGKRYQLINVWRPIGHAAEDFPLAVVDWRTTKKGDLVKVDLMYPLHHRTNPVGGEDDDRGKETLPDVEKGASTEGYEVKGETYGVVEGTGKHQFYYVKGMTPEEVLFIKCFDSWGQGKEGGREGVAALTPHTAFVDPQTPVGVKGRESIEVRCLVFYEE